MALLPPPERWLDVVAAVCFLGLAAWILLLDFSKRLYRGFALVLVIRALTLLAFAADREGVSDTAGRMAPYLDLAAPFAVLWFVEAYRRTYEGANAVRPWYYLIVGSFALLFTSLEIAYALDHSLISGPAPNYRPGPLAIFGVLTPITFAGAGYWFVRRARNAAAIVHSRALLVVGTAFVAEPLAESISYVLGVPLLWIVDSAAARATTADWLGPSNLVGFSVCFAISLFTAASLLASSSTTGLRRLSKRALVALAVVLIAYVAAESIGLISFNVWLTTVRAMDGALAVAVAAAVACAIARYALFDLSLRLRVTFSRGTLVMLFTGLGFAAAETFANWVGDAMGVAIGALAAGLLFFVLHPLQRLADRVAKVAVPNGEPPETLAHKDQLDLFREQAELAWLDGIMARKERVLLDALRVRLNIPLELAARIENEAANAFGSQRPHRRVAPS